MTLRLNPDGSVVAVYGEEVDLALLGAVSIRRASHVEPNPDGTWSADLSPVSGPVLGSFAKRSEALRAEIDWLDSALSKGTIPHTTEVR
mgnify:FL=1